MLGRLFIASATLALIGSQAEAATSLTGNLNVQNGSPSTSAGAVTFTLNPDGTISATVTSTSGNIAGFGFDSAGVMALTESGFSPATPDNPIGWTDLYGTQFSGFSCSSCGTTESWTIGSAGAFTDVFQAISGTNSQYDFYLLTSDGEWGGNAEGEASAVPEPATWAMFLAGLGGIGLILRREREQRGART